MHSYLGDPKSALGFKDQQGSQKGIPAQANRYLNRLKEITVFKAAVTSKIIYIYRQQGNYN